MKVFAKLHYEDRLELWLYPYGVDRGRIEHDPETNTWTILGTPGCEKHKKELIDKFNLNGLDLIIDFKTDTHYKTIPTHVGHIQSVAKEIGLQFTDAKFITHFIEIP